jgi:hypothetical protein
MAAVVAADRARVAPPRPRPAVLVTAATAAPPRPVTTTTVRRTARAATSTTRPTTSTSRSTSTTTTTTTSTTSTTRHEQTRQGCLALAAVNHYSVVAANAAWFRQQLHTLTRQHLLDAPQHQALLLEEQQALSEIDAQYSIDQSNCYLDRGPGGRVRDSEPPAP